jgi:preprotein translocase subunit SecA
MFNILKVFSQRQFMREAEKLRPIVAQVNAMEPEMMALSDQELAGLTLEFRERLGVQSDREKNGPEQSSGLDDLLPEAFAAVREAARRTIGLRHYDVQLIGGAVLHRGRIGEMRTGEGKTLVATLPLYLNALAGRGVHLVTVNDYLAKRDAQWMGPVFSLLGMSVGIIQHESAFVFDPDYHHPDPALRFLRPADHRAAAYLTDITYGTNNEYGFDYLRDNMVADLSQKVQNQLYFAIVDEVDNILIDEARTPLIISGPAEEATDYYAMFARLVPRLQRERDFTVDERTKSISLTEDGIERIEKMLGVNNLYDPGNYQLTHYLDNAVRAQFIYNRDEQYIVENGEIIIIDEFTGRKMPGRRYSEGLHQAIEAKEGVRVQRENVTLARITFQNYFRLYEKLAGMTGTAATEAEEFRRIYNLDVATIPTHRPMVRKDQSDLVYKSEPAKFKAVVEEIVEMHAEGRPVLVGTVSIEKSERLAELLKRRGVPHQVLNAKQHEQEAAIIAQAGRPNAVTIATNMAGRGVDILLGGNPAGLLQDALKKRGYSDDEEVPPDVRQSVLAEIEGQVEKDRAFVRELGGLHIIGTERHESRRIDNQLRGRAGRQGDLGSSRFYVALEDELMRRFGGSRIASLMDRLGLEEDIPLEHGLVTKSIENAQEKVESYNFDIRKHVVEYDDVMNRQREVLYDQRRAILKQESQRPLIMTWVEAELGSLVEAHLGGDRPEEWDWEALLKSVTTIFPLPEEFEISAGEGGRPNRELIVSRLLELAESVYDAREAQFGADTMRAIERAWALRVIDQLWIQHLTAIDDLREGIGLRAYGQRDPLVEYKREAHEMWESLLDSIHHDIVYTIFHVVPRTEPIERPRALVAATTNRESENGATRRPRAAVKVGRNDQCPCGSGRKFKRCHGR